MPVLAPLQPLSFQHGAVDTGLHHSQIKSYQVQQSLKHLREKAKEHEIELKKQMTTVTATTAITASAATCSTNSSSSGTGSVLTGGSSSNGPSLMVEKRRESSQPKLISAETVSKNMQPNIHLQFNSIKTTTTAATNGYAPIQQQQYFNRNWAANGAYQMSPGGPTSMSPTALGQMTVAAAHYQHLATSTPKPQLMGGIIDFPQYHVASPHHNHLNHGNHHGHNHHHHNSNNYNNCFQDRSFSENTYENCHIYENSKPRSKSVETYLGSASGNGARARNPIPVRKDLPSSSREQRVCSSENLAKNASGKREVTDSSRKKSSPSTTTTATPSTGETTSTSSPLSPSSQNSTPNLLNNQQQSKEISTSSTTKQDDSNQNKGHSKPSSNNNYKRINRSMEILDINMMHHHQTLPFSYMPPPLTASHRHRHRPRHHRQHVNDIDWSTTAAYEVERGGGDRYLDPRYGEPTRMSRKSRQRPHQHTEIDDIFQHQQPFPPRILLDRVFHYRKARSQSNDSKLALGHRSDSRSNSQSSSSKKLSYSEIHNTSSHHHHHHGHHHHNHGHHHSSRHPSSSGHRQPSSGGASDSTKSRSKIDSATTPSNTNAGNPVSGVHTVVDTGVQTTQTGNSNDQIEETNYVKELKRQLEILKNEITRLQNAQSNLEKSLKQTTTAFRPFMYTGFGGEADFGDFTGLEQFLNSLDPTTGNPFQLTTTSPTPINGGAQPTSSTSKVSPNPNSANAILSCALDSSSATIINLPQSAQNALAGHHSAYHLFDPTNLNENIYNLSQFNVKSKEIIENLNCTGAIMNYNHHIHQQHAQPIPSLMQAAAGAPPAGMLNGTTQSTPSTSTSHINSLSSNSVNGAPSSNQPQIAANKPSASQMNLTGAPIMSASATASPVIKAGPTTSIYGDVELIKSTCKIGAPATSMPNGAPGTPLDLESMNQIHHYQQLQHQSRINSKPPAANSLPNGAKKQPSPPMTNSQSLWSLQQQQQPQSPVKQAPNNMVRSPQANGNPNSIPAIIPINYDQLISTNQTLQQIPGRSLSSKPALHLETSSSPDSSQSSNRNLTNPSPNAVLYQKLLELVSTSADLANQSELSNQMSTLLSNPNIRARLKQLHTQLLKDPNEYWPKLENILLDDSKLQKQMIPQKDQIKITQDLIDLKNFYSKEFFNNNGAGSNNSASSTHTSTANMSNVNSTMSIPNGNNSSNNNNNNAYYAKTQPRIINREIKK